MRSFSAFLLLATSSVAAAADQPSFSRSGACDAQAARFSQWARRLIAVERDSPRIPLQSELRLVELDAGAIDRVQPNLELAPGKAWLEGRPLPSEEALRKEADDFVSPAKIEARCKTNLAAVALAERERICAARKTEKRTLVVSIDRATPFSEVAAWTQRAAGVGFDRVQFVFSKRNAVVPPASKAAQQLEHVVDGEGKTDLEASLLGAAFEKCPAWKKVFDDVSGVDPSMKFALVAGGSADALKACRCAFDLDEAAAILWHLGPGKTLSTAVLVTMRGEQPLQIAAPAGEPWSVVHRKVAAAASAAKGRAVRLLAK
jgi:hypothetical protein